LAYGRTVTYPFVHDDVVFIQQNNRLADFNLTEIFSQKPGSASPVINTYYRPALEVLTRAQYRLFHRNPAGYHVFNIILHILNSFLVYFLADIFSKGKKGLAFSVGLLFLLHPAQTEAVACIAGVSNLLFTSLCLVSFYLYVKAQRQKRRIYYGLSLWVFFISLLAKEQAVMLLFLILLYELCLAQDDVGGKGFCRIARVGGYAGVVAGYFILRKALMAGGALPAVMFNQELGLRILSIPKTLLIYMRILFFPNDLHYYRSLDVLQPFIWPCVGLVAVVALIFGCVRWIQPPYRALAVFGGGWFLVCLLPVLNIIPLINEYSLILTAEHFLYMPMAGAGLFVAGFFHALMNRISSQRRKIFGGILLAEVGFIFLFMTIGQNRFWRAEVPLFERTVRFEQNFGRAHLLLGKAYYFQKDFFKAAASYRRALEIMQGYASKATDAHARRVYLGFIKGIHFDLAHCFEAIGDWGGAVGEYKNALVLDPVDGVIHNNIGVAYLKLGMMEDARRSWEEAFRLNPDDRMAVHNLAGYYLATGRKEEAKKLWEEE
jgi:tetratricopeptide (TPR) repeat protein